MLQKVLDPFAGAPRDADGTILYSVTQKEMEAYMPDEERLRAQFEVLNSKNEVWDVDEEEEDAFRLALVKELEDNNAGFSIEDFNKVLDKEFGVFHKDKYDYVKDLKDAYKQSLSTTTEQKIFKTLPDYLFWDIKTPQQPKPFLRHNPYNPFRGREFNSFFEMRNYEEYRLEQT